MELVYDDPIMSWSGKIVGAIIGFIVAGPVGLFVGLVIGYLYDIGYFAKWGFAARSFSQSGQGETKTIFFESTFAIMGYIAKSDGRVSEHEIKAAERMMQQLNLSGEQKRAAIHAFNQGKQPDFDLSEALNRLKRASLRHPSLLKTFLEMQIQIAYADNQRLTPNKRAALEEICRHLGLVGFNFSEFENQYRAQYEYQQHRAQQRPQQTLADAYRILGVSPSANQQEIKKAYRRLMSQNHPDKLIAKGVPEEMIKLANQKTQQIKEAYETICQVRGF